MSTRIFAGTPTSVDKDKRSFDIVITSETPVREYIRNPEVKDESARDAYILADVILESDGLDMSRAPGMPLMDSHDMWGGITKILGKVDDLHVAEAQVLGRAFLNRRNADLIDDIDDGHYNQISAGFGHNEIELEHRAGDVPIARSKSWTLYEASMVAVGADPNAQVRNAQLRTLPMPKVTVRNANPNPQQEVRKMDNEALTKLVETAEQAAAAVDAAATELGSAVSADLGERAKRFRSAADPVPVPAVVPAPAPAVTAPVSVPDAEINALRTLAGTYGLRSFVDDLASLGTEAADIRLALRAEVMKGGAARTAAPQTPAAALQPVTVTVPDVIDARAIMDNVRKALTR